MAIPLTALTEDQLPLKASLTLPPYETGVLWSRHGRPLGHQENNKKENYRTQSEIGEMDWWCDSWYAWKIGPLNWIKEEVTEDFTPLPKWLY